jgi:hypothetical protein
MLKLSRPSNNKVSLQQCNPLILDDESYDIWVQSIQKFNSLESLYIISSMIPKSLTFKFFVISSRGMTLNDLYESSFINIRAHQNKKALEYPHNQESALNEHYRAC